MAKKKRTPRYRVEFLRFALKDFKALPQDIVKRLDRRIRSLANNPRPQGTKKLQGHENLYRLRVGDYRVIYEIDDDSSVVLIVRARHRGEAYENL